MSRTRLIGTGQQFLASPDASRMRRHPRTRPLRDGDTRCGVVQAITYVVHASTHGPDVRYIMKPLVSDYLEAA